VAQVGAPQLGVTQPGLAQVGAAKVDAVQVGDIQVGAAQVGTIQVVNWVRIMTFYKGARNPLLARVSSMCRPILHAK
jgi:hypothetical protein